MKTHELKQNYKLFDDAKLRRKNAWILKNDCGYHVGDILNLKCFAFGNYYRSAGPVALDGEEGVWDHLRITDENNADTIKTKIISIIIAEDWNSEEDLGIPVFAIKENGEVDLMKIFNTGKVIANKFGTDKLPEDYVIVETEMIDDRSRKKSC